MSDQKILEKAIQKAIDGGYQSDDAMFISCDTSLDYMSVIESYCVECFINERRHYSIIFDHDFAQALWGKYSDYPFYVRVDDELVIVPEWKYQLMQMVISEDPIKYLGENI